MALRGHLAKIFIDNIPMALSTSTMTVSNVVNVISYGVLQTSSQLKIAGLPDHNVSLSGYMQDETATDIRAKIQSAIEDTDTLFMWVVDTENSKIAGCFPTSFSTEFNLDTPLADLITVTGKFERVLNSYHGYLVVDEVTVDATGVVGTYTDFGAQGTSGGNIILLVTDITGTATDATIVLESDDNTGFSSDATEATMQFSAEGTFTDTLSGTVDRYLRVDVTDLGGATDFTIVVMVAINGVTQ